jgi:hypothetical protein
LRSRSPLPAKFLNAPGLDEWWNWYFLAFLDLSSCRSGMGDGPIMWTAMNAYAERHGLTTLDDYLFFKELINSIDTAYIEYQSKKSDKKGQKIGGEKTPAPQPQPRPRPKKPIVVKRRK